MGDTPKPPHKSPAQKPSTKAPPPRCANLNIVMQILDVFFKHSSPELIEILCQSLLSLLHPHI